MRLPFSDRIERGRIRTGELASRPGDDYGMFELRRNGAREVLRCMVSTGSAELPWEHVSVSIYNRVPTWDEMCWVKDMFWTDEDMVMQVHPPESQYVNYHPYCLHLWRPLLVDIPAPPMIAVGPQKKWDGAPDTARREWRALCYSREVR